MKPHILVTDDEPLTRKSLQEILRYEGYNVSVAVDGREALEIMRQYPVDVVLADLFMPNLGGIELLKVVKKHYPDTQVVIMTAYGNVENAVEAMRLGACDYMSKPIEDKQIKSLMEKINRQKDKSPAAGGQAIKIKMELLKTESVAETKRYQFYGIIGKDDKMQKIYSMIEAIADSSSTVLICGESGTGKRMIAQAIHQADGSRCKEPFIEVSCGALPETLLESELFGHVKGAFTGAIKDRPGRFELADGGTVLLDEIDTCSPALQVKLLRILEEGTFERVGDTKTLKVNLRIIAATNQNLEELVKRRSFREDLYWRLNVITIQLPSLRERIGDIALLIEHFLKKYNTIRENIRNGSKIEKISDTAMDALLRYNWPGNIRELENTIERACILSKDSIIHMEDLPDTIRNFNQKQKLANTAENFSLKSALKVPEKDIILEALERTNWNCTRASVYLGINRTTLYNKMKIYGVERGKHRANEGIISFAPLEKAAD